MSSSSPNLPASVLPEHLSDEEAERLREVWLLAGSSEPVPVPSAEETEKALSVLRVRRPSRAQSESCHAPVQRGDRSTDISAREAARRTNETRARRRLAWPSWKRIAGTLTVLVLLAAAGVFWWTRPVVKEVPMGERLAVTLPDGSNVELNSGSQIRYRRHFMSGRRVELEGEAFFDVAEHGSPFTVETFNAEARVLGTRFSVRAWPREPGRITRVALRSGRVVLIPEDAPAREVRMTPGEAWSVRAESGAGLPRITPAGISVEEATAWRRDELVFKNAPLDAVLGDVERRFGKDLRVRADDSLRQRRISLALRQPTSAEEVVRDLVLALGLRYRETATGFEIHAPRR